MNWGPCRTGLVTGNWTALGDWLLAVLSFESGFKEWQRVQISVTEGFVPHSAEVSRRGR